MKKIVIIGPAHPLRGGLASYNERLAKSFQDQGHDVEIFTFSLQYPGFLFPGTTQFSTEPAPKNLKINVCINSVNPLNWLTVGTRLRKMRPDLIVVRYWLPFMGPCLGTILRLVKKNNHTKVVCIADNIIPHEKRPGDKAFTRYFMKPIDGFITMSEKVLKDLSLFQSTMPAKFVPHPLYDNFGDQVSMTDARNHLQISEKDRVVLFFGFIRHYKGLDILFETIACLKHRNNAFSDTKFLIAGEFYESPTPYLDQIKELGLSDTISVYNEFIGERDVKLYVSAADFIIQPYRNATQSGVTPMAYHFLKPMLVTNVGGLADTVPHDKVGLVVEPNPNSIAEGILQLYERGTAHFMPHLISEKKKYSWLVLTQQIKKLACIEP